VFGRDRHHGSRAQSAKGKSHKRKQLAAVGIKQQRVHFITAAEAAIRPEADADAPPTENGTRDHPQPAPIANWYMIGRVGHDLAVGLLLVRRFDQLDRLLKIEQRL
jgi:hypothetical protein